MRDFPCQLSSTHLGPELFEIVGFDLVELPISLHSIRCTNAEVQNTFNDEISVRAESFVVIARLDLISPETAEAAKNAANEVSRAKTTA